MRPQVEQIQRSTRGHVGRDEMWSNEVGGEIPSQRAAMSSAQAGGLGGERPVQRPGNGMQETGHHRGVSQGYGPERRQGKDHRRVPSGLRQQGQPQDLREDGRPLGRVPVGVQQQEMKRQMPREASRQPQGDVRGTARNFVDDVKQENRDEQDELKRGFGAVNGRRTPSTEVGNGEAT